MVDEQQEECVNSLSLASYVEFHLSDAGKLEAVVIGLSCKDEKTKSLIIDEGLLGTLLRELKAYLEKFKQPQISTQLTLDFGPAKKKESCCDRIIFN